MGFPSAVLDIQAMSQPTPGIEEYIVQGFVYDGGSVYDGSSFVINDYIFDQGVFGCFRWKILEIITPPNPGQEFKCRVRWADEGTHPMPDFGLSAGASCLCSASPGAFGVAQCPSLSLNQAYGMSEILYNSIQNSNDRQNDIGLLSFSTSNKIQQQCASPIPAGKPYSKRPDGRIEAAISNTLYGQKFVGITIDAFLNAGDLGYTTPSGPIIANVLDGLGFLPGDEIFVNQTVGYTKNPGAFTGDSDSIIRIGIADCAAGIASATAKHIIMMPHIISRPSV
jgi:hypothetical protein